MGDEMLSTPEAAQYLGVHVETLRRWRRDGDFGPTPYELRRNRFYYRLDELNTFREPVKEMA